MRPSTSLPTRRRCGAELASYGFAFEVEKKEKQVRRRSTRPSSREHSINLLEIGVPGGLENHFPAGRKLKIKMELDTDPPAGRKRRWKRSCCRSPSSEALPTLLSLRREDPRVALPKLEAAGEGARLLRFCLVSREGHPGASRAPAKADGADRTLGGRKSIDRRNPLGLLRKRFTEVDFDQARADVLPFIRDADAVALWGETFFNGFVGPLEGGVEGSNRVGDGTQPCRVGHWVVGVLVRTSHPAICSFLRPIWPKRSTRSRAS